MSGANQLTSGANQLTSGVDEYNNYRMNDLLLSSRKEILMVLLIISAVLFFILFFDSVHSNPIMESVHSDLLEKIAKKLNVV